MSSRSSSLLLTRVSIGLVSIVSVLIGLAVPATGSATPTAMPASGSAASRPLLSPPALGAQVSALVAGATDEWTLHQTPEGWLIDPVLGRATSSYGLAMTGQSMVVLGVSRADPALIEDGLRAELAEVAQPDDGGFELLALSEAFAWNDHHLAGMGAWAAARGAIATFIATHAPLVSDAGDCYSEERCYDNLKLVAAVADLSLLQTGLPNFTLGTPAAIRAEALAALARAARNAGTDARRIGTPGFRGAGILSDPGRNPLAYHALSTLMLGQAVQSLGASAPASVIAAFSRCARALIGLMAPDGDVAYIGRGQGQVWTAAASIDALSIAAQMTRSATWRGRYLAGAALELSRLRALYPRDGWGLPLVPRLAGGLASGLAGGDSGQAPGQAPNYLGIDGYANTVQYNGLALWALSEAAHTLSLIPPTPYQAVPSTENGTFLDPSHTKFATVTDGSLWYAIHGTDSDPADARYGFGLISVERDTAQGWRAVLPYPPLTSALTSTPATSGPTLIRDGRSPHGRSGHGRSGDGRSGEQVLHPVKTRIAASSSGAVTIHAAWGAADGNAADGKTPGGKAPAANAKAANPELATTWVYRPTSTPTSTEDGAENSITLSFHAHANCAYQFPVWYWTGSQMRIGRAGLTITAPNGSSQSYDFSTAVAIHTSSEIYHSAYAEDLSSIILTVPAASRPREVRYTTTLSG